MSATTLPYLSVIEFRGEDAADFLHRQLSADINRLPDGAATFACLCQPKGRVIALLLVCRGEGSVRVVCAAQLAETVAAWLGRFVFRDDVQIEHRTDWSVLGATGPGPGDAVEPLPGLHYAVAETEGGADGAFRAEELKRGIAWLDERTSEAFLPQMLGAESAGALSYRKGCYPGQEIVARTHFLGRLKQRPLVATAADGAELERTLEPGLRVTLSGAGEEAEAVVVDRAVDAEGRGVALLVVRASEPFTVDSLVSGDSRLSIDGHWLPIAQGSATT